MSWLSTLGGGYSALGEQFGKCVGFHNKLHSKLFIRAPHSLGGGCR